MNIRKIVLNNFKIYKGQNELNFDPDPNKNIHIISGFNGFGKTTLLSSLVWCLYGKNMQEVDKEFKEAIVEAGGYKFFLKENLNRAAKAEGEALYEVRISFGQINIPGLVFNDIEIVRSFSLNDQSENVTVLIDGRENELVNELGLELFIHDFILPKEVAKFFFFDAEKITALAEMNTIEDKRQLSKAYSEVLGIKKYDDLRNNLLNLRYKYSKASVKPEEKQKVVKLEKEENELNRLLELQENKLEQLQESIEIDKSKLNDLQLKLIKEGTDHSVKQIIELRREKDVLGVKIDQLKSEFKDLLELAPFAIAFKQMEEVEEQLQAENLKKSSIQDRELVSKKIKAFNKDLLDAFKDIKSRNIVDQLLVKHFLTGMDDQNGDIKVLHDFTDQEFLQFGALMSSLRKNYLNKFKEISRELKLHKTQQNYIIQKVIKLESKETGKVVKAIRQDKDEVENCILNAESKKEQLIEEKGQLKQELITKERILSELLKKVNLNEGFLEKDILAERLITKLTGFIDKIRKEKKNALEKRIASTLKDLMHKDSFIDRIQVDIFDEIIEIKIIDTKGREIPKNALSKGEQQLYASAILKSFVDESNIEFPVFVDSPLQKFDAQHATNIIKGFYPYISKQVVIFPLLNKELVENEYQLMMKHVKSAHIIRNLNQDASTFEKVKPENLFINNSQTAIHV